MGEWMTSLFQSPGGVAGTIGGSILTTLAIARKFMLNDKVASATAAGNVDVIQRLMEAADRAEARAAQAEARADLAYRERNEAYTKIGELTEQVRQLQVQIEDLKRTVNAQNH